MYTSYNHILNSYFLPYITWRCNIWAVLTIFASCDVLLHSQTFTIPGIYGCIERYSIYYIKIWDAIILCASTCTLTQVSFTTGRSLSVCHFHEHNFILPKKKKKKNPTVTIFIHRLLFDYSKTFSWLFSMEIISNSNYNINVLSCWFVMLHQSSFWWGSVRYTIKNKGFRKIKAQSKKA